MRRRAEEGQRDTERQREGEKWVGGRTEGATRNSYQLIIVKKRAGRRVRKTGMVFWRLAVQS